MCQYGCMAFTNNSTKMSTKGFKVSRIFNIIFKKKVILLKFSYKTLLKESTLEDAFYKICFHYICRAVRNGTDYGSASHIVKP